MSGAPPSSSQHLASGLRFRRLFFFFFSGISGVALFPPEENSIRADLWFVEMTILPLHLLILERDARQDF